MSKVSVYHAFQHDDYSHMTLDWQHPMGMMSLVAFVYLAVDDLLWRGAVFIHAQPYGVHWPAIGQLCEVKDPDRDVVASTVTSCVLGVLDRRDNLKTALTTNIQSGQLKHTLIDRFKVLNQLNNKFFLG